MNEKHDALIKRIDERIAYWSEGLPSTGPTIELLQDCRAEIKRLTLSLKGSLEINLKFAQDRETADAKIERLSEPVRYVPMTDDEWDEISKKWQSDSVECMKNGQSIQPFHLYIEAAVIRLAIAQGAKLEVQE